MIRPDQVLRYLSLLTLRYDFILFKQGGPKGVHMFLLISRKFLALKNYLQFFSSSVRIILLLRGSSCDKSDRFPTWSLHVFIIVLFCCISKLSDSAVYTCRGCCVDGCQYLPATFIFLLSLVMHHQLNRCSGVTTDSTSPAASVENFVTKEAYGYIGQILWPSTVKHRFTVPRFTGSLDLPRLNSIPRKQALCVNQCKMYPDIPCFSIYRA